MSEKNEWKLVPVVPTDEMVKAAFDQFEISAPGFATGNDARRAIYAAMLNAAPSAPGDAQDERQAFEAKLGAHVREWACRQGWKPKDAEGAWEFAQRISYEAGRRDATPYWARAYEEQENYDQAVADAIKRVAVRIEFAGRRATAAGDALPNFDIEAAAQKLAECMDYPWAHMPEQGRTHMREYAQAVIDAALAAQVPQQGEA